MNSEFEDAALKYAEKSLAVFPLKPRTKEPIYKGGFKKATTNPETIKRWWRKNPDANIGIATGQKSGGLVVFDEDIDEKKGKDGSESLKNWLNEKGLPDFPDTVTSKTGSGGYHYLYMDPKHSHKTRAGVLYDGSGIDIRAEGGYIVAPPSIHPNGNRYEWELSGHIDDMDILDISEGDNSVSVFLEFTDNKESDENGTGFVSPKTIEDGKRNDTLYRLACSMQSKGYADETIRAAIVAENKAKCDPPLDDDELDKIIKSALKWKKGHSDNNPVILPGGNEVSDVMQMLKGKTKTMSNGDQIHKVANTTENFLTVMRNDPKIAGKIRYDVLAYAPKYFGLLPWKKDHNDTMGDWMDEDDANLRNYLESVYQLTGDNKYRDAIMIILSENKFNPVVDYFKALEPWDGEYRIENLLPYYLGAEKSRYTTEVMRTFMLGALARAHNPGCKFDTMLVLVGEQGIGKSEFLRRLAINSMWFDDNFDTLEGKEAAENLRGKWIVELAELAALKKKTSVETVKSFITSRSDNYREPYGRRTQDRPRSCVFAATTNTKDFLTDRTGNRRFLPVEVDKEKQKYSLFKDEEKVDEYIRLAWAEAYHYFKEANGEPRLILPDDLAEEAIRRQREHLEDDPWIGQIQNWLDGQNGLVCSSDIWFRGLRKTQDLERKDSNKIIHIMRNDIEGWHEVGKKRTKNHGPQICFERDTNSDPDALTFEPVDDEVDF